MAKKGPSEEKQSALSSTQVFYSVPASVVEGEKGKFHFLMLVISKRTMAHQNRILSDQTDILPLYHHIFPPSEKAEQALPPIDNDRKHFCRFRIDLYIIHKSDTAAIRTIDDLFAAQVRYTTAIHKIIAPSIT